jgi:hypothetical protein
MDVPLGLFLAMAESQRWPLPCSAGRGPHWQSAPSVIRSPTRRGTPCSVGPHTACPTGRFLLADRNRGCLPAVTHPRVAMRLHARGLRETVPGRRALQQHAALLTAVPPAPAQRVGDREHAGAVDLAAMGALGGTLGRPRGRGPASAPSTGAVVVSGCGRRQAEGVLWLQA